MVFEDHFAVIEQTTDESGFAVIDTAAGNESEHLLVLVFPKVGLDVFGDLGMLHQK